MEDFLGLRKGEREQNGTGGKTEIKWTLNPETLELNLQKFNKEHPGDRIITWEKIELLKACNDEWEESMQPLKCHNKNPIGVQLAIN